MAPTEIVDAQDASGDRAATAYDKAHGLVLDDASSHQLHQRSNTDDPFPWFTPTSNVRVGAPVTFIARSCSTSAAASWVLDPTPQVTGDGSGRASTFGNNRPAAPDNVGGDIKLATFNVLNFFPTRRPSTSP